MLSRGIAGICWFGDLGGGGGNAGERRCGEAVLVDFVGLDFKGRTDGLEVLHGGVLDLSGGELEDYLQVFEHSGEFLADHRA